MLRFIFSFACLVVLLSSCQDTSSVGSGLLENEKFDVGFRANFPISSALVSDKRTEAYRNGISLSTYSVGKLNDPYFGEKTAEVFFEVGFNPTVSIPNFRGFTLDSMVMVLTYDTTGMYGNPEVPHHLKVFPLTEDLSGRDTIYMDELVGYDQNVLAEKVFIPAPLDSISIINHSDTSELRVPAQIRMRMDDQWAAGLFSDTLLYTDSDALKTYMRGFYLKSETENSLLGLNLGSAANGEDGVNRLTVYFTTSGGEKNIYTFRISARRGTLVSQDRGMSLANELITGGNNQDSLLIIEPHNGYNAVLRFPDLTFLEDKIVNHALLKVYTADLPGDNSSFYRPIRQLLAYRYNEEGELETIRDLLDLTLIQTNLALGFGGRIAADGNGYVYEMNVTKRIKEIIADPTSNEIILAPISRAQFPTRSILRNGGNIDRPAVLEVTYTIR